MHLLGRVILICYVSLLAHTVMAQGVVQLPNKIEPPPVDYPRENVSTGYHVDQSWPKGKSAFAWKAMSSIAIDDQGLIWTVNRGEMPIQVYSADGKLVNQWGKDHFLTPHQLVFGSDGHVWIADAHAHAVYKYTRAGERLLTIGIPGEPGDDDRHLKMPTDMVEGLKGEIIVSDGYRNNRVIVFDSQGKFIRKWGELGTKPGQFSLPHSIDRDSQGRVYVADRNNSRVQVFTPDGKYLTEWVNLCQPWTVRITDKDEVYVCGTSPLQWQKEDVMVGIPPKDQIVMKLDTTGRVVSWWGFPKGPDLADAGAKPGELAWVHGLAVDKKGNLYLGDIMGQRAQKFLIVK
ncbi:MAG: peptidyl-alpha-hydroxyglycine alpha-amidating lyase family protein [Pirellula sp.]